MSQRKVFFIVLFISLFFTFSIKGEGIEAISIFGNNPQMTEIGRASENKNFNYNSYGTRQIGISLLYDKSLFTLAVSDPREESGERTNSAMIEYRSFGEIQWGIKTLHFKNFELHDGTDHLGPALMSRNDLELYSTQIYALKNISHPEYSIEDALNGLKQIKESGWAGIFGGKLSNTYLHGEQSIVPSAYSSTLATEVNSYNLAALIGLAGTFSYQDFYISSLLGFGMGPLYSTWKDTSGSHQSFTAFGQSHVFDITLGYSSEKWTILFKISTLSDSTFIEHVTFENLSSNGSMIYAYRF